MLIYTILRGNPPNLLSNVLYIQRFRSPEKLLSEPGYYFTNLARAAAQGSIAHSAQLSAIHFIQSMDAKALTIDPQHFEQCLTRAAEAHSQASPHHTSPPCVFDGRAGGGCNAGGSVIHAGSHARVDAAVGATAHQQQHAGPGLPGHHIPDCARRPDGVAHAVNDQQPTHGRACGSAGGGPAQPGRPGACNARRTTHPPAQLLAETGKGAIDKFLTCAAEDLALVWMCGGCVRVMCAAGRARAAARLPATGGPGRQARAHPPAQCR